jgi:hypothetical protein
MVLVSIIIGLGIAEILKGIAQLFRHRDSISIFWVHIVLIVFVFTALLQQWWEIWGLHVTDAKRPYWIVSHCTPLVSATITQR